MTFEKNTKTKLKFQKGPLTKDALLKVAIKLITSKGLDKLSIREVARQSKTSSATVFYHFKSKEVLVHDIINRVVLNNHNTVSELVNIQDDAYQKLYKHIIGNLTWAHTHPEEGQILALLYYLGSVHSDFAMTYKKLLENARERIKVHLFAGQRESLFFFEPTPEQLAITIHNTLVGAFVNMAASQNRTEIDSEHWHHFLKQVTKYKSKTGI